MQDPSYDFIVTPIQQGWNHMRRILFEPFDLEKWLVIGFSCFLAHLIEYLSYFNGGGSGNSGSSSSDFSQQQRSADEFLVTSSDFAFLTQSADETFRSLLESFNNTIQSFGTGWIVWLVVIAFVTVIFGVMIVALWLDCRGIFMFIDNVANNRGAIVDPWKKYARQAWQLFWFYLLVCMGFLVAVILAIALFVASSFNLESNNLATLFVFFGILICFSFGIALASFLIKVCVVPRMFVTQCDLMQAVRDSFVLICNYPVQWLLFTVINLALWITSFILIAFTCCITCCLTFLPYLHFVLFLPLYTFVLSYNLEFLRQFGSGWNPFPDTNPPQLNTPDAA